MFLQDFTLEQKIAFFSLAKRLIAVDERISREERVLLNLLSREMELPSKQRASRQSLDKLCGHFQTRRAKYSVLLELIGLSLADKTFSRSEKKFVNQVASAMSIGKGLLPQMIDLVERMTSLTEEAELFLAQG